MIISLFHGLKNRGKILPWGDVSTFMAAITKIENMSVKTVSFNLFLWLYPNNTNLISNFKPRAFAPQNQIFFQLQLTTRQTP